MFAGAVYLSILAAVWNMDGLNIFSYHSMNGFLIVVFIAQYVFPLIRAEQPTRAGLLMSGAAATLACFSAFSNGPGLILLGLSALPGIFILHGFKGALSISKWFAVGAIAVAFAVLGWMLVFADLKGYFVYHIYFNQDVYAKVIGFSLFDFLKNIQFSFLQIEIVHSFATFLMACWVYIYFTYTKHKSGVAAGFVGCISIVALVTGVLLTNPRGYAYFVDAGFVVTNAALFSLFSAVVVELTPSMGRVWGFIRSATLPIVSVLLAYQVAAYAVTFNRVPQGDFQKYVGTMKPGTEPVYEFVRSITKLENDLLVTNYGALIYLKADRLPASGNLFYLAWQAEYNRHPIGGYRIDICADIARHRPAVVWLLNRRTAGRSLDEYEPCVLSLISNSYTALAFGSPWYIRKDVWGTVKDRAPRESESELNLEPNSSKILYRSAYLGSFSPVPLLMDQNHIQRRLGLRRIGILFTTYGHVNDGRAELHLEGPRKSSASVTFELRALSDNEYKYFDLDSKEYTGGEIRSINGGGVSAWESHFTESWDAYTVPYTCIIYEYSDGSRRYTPACPIM